MNLQNSEFPVVNIVSVSSLYIATAPETQEQANKTA